MTDRAYQLHILVYESACNPGTWIGHCLDYDVMTQGTSEHEAYAAALDAVALLIQDRSGRMGGTVESRDPAEDACWGRWLHARQP
jgi:hypothetical protein